jgi:hypothetical protein
LKDKNQKAAFANAAFFLKNKNAAQISPSGFMQNMISSQWPQGVF